MSSTGRRKSRGVTITVSTNHHSTTWSQSHRIGMETTSASAGRVTGSGAVTKAGASRSAGTAVETLSSALEQMVETAGGFGPMEGIPLEENRGRWHLMSPEFGTGEPRREARLLHRPSTSPGPFVGEVASKLKGETTLLGPGRMVGSRGERGRAGAGRTPALT